MMTWVFLRGLTREARHWGDFPQRFRAEFVGELAVGDMLPPWFVAASALAAMNGTQTKPAFCSQTGPWAVACGEPPSAPKMPAPMTSGTANCTIDTPRWPRPAFMPSA